MKILDKNDTLWVSGGYDNHGYNFSFIVRNGIALGVAGWVVTGGDPNGFVGGFMLGAGYGAVMMAVTLADHIVFSGPLQVRH